MELKYISFLIANSIYGQTIHIPKKSNDINQPNISTLIYFHKKSTDIVIIFIFNRIRFYNTKALQAPTLVNTYIHLKINNDVTVSLDTTYIKIHLNYFNCRFYIWSKKNHLFSI